MKSSELSSLGQRLSQLANFLDNGIPLREGALALSQAETSPGIAKILSVLAAKLKQGVEMHKAFKAAGLHLPPQPAGSRLEGDRLKTSLEFLAEHYRARGRIQSLLRRGLAYPAVLAAGLLSLGVLYSALLIPRMEQLYLYLDQPIPPVQQVVLAHHTTAWAFLFLLVAGLLVLRWRLPAWSAVLWYAFPGMARLLRHLAASELLAALALRLRCGEAPSLALRHATAAVGNAWFHARLERARPRGDKDCSVYDALVQGSVFKGTEGLALAAGEGRGDSGALLADAASDVIADLQKETEALLIRLGPACIILLVLVLWMLLKLMLFSVLQTNEFLP